MTYGNLKITARTLLTSDFQLPEEDEGIIALLGMAYNYIVDKCDVLNLNTLDKSSDVVRLGRGNYMIRKPDMPVADTDELDIDDDLGYAAASLIASYISEKKTPIHQARADDKIRSYNAKVDEYIERLKAADDDS